MSTSWNVLFYESLAEYVQLYVEARGDPAARAKILKDCGNSIMMSPLHGEQVIDLPEHLYRVRISHH